MLSSTESEGYADTSWDYKTVVTREEEITRVLAEEGEAGWEMMGLAARASAAGDYLVVLRRKKSMMGI
jgi:hypothetical protein